MDVYSFSIGKSGAARLLIRSDDEDEAWKSVNESLGDRVVGAHIELEDVLPDSDWEEAANNVGDGFTRRLSWNVILET